MGVNKSCKIELEFRVDVFRFLFKGKGRTPPTGRGLYYDLDDFDSTYFCADWYKTYDKLGDGCCLEFPVRLESRLKWSSTVYSSSRSVKPRIFTEMIYVTLVKSRC